MKGEDLAILFSGGTDSMALTALSAFGREPDLPRPRKIHLLHMLNGMSRFHDFPRRRYEAALEILSRQAPADAPLPEIEYLELDMGRLFQGFWLDRYEELMPRFNGKNLVCVACKLAMHTRAIEYCTRNLVGRLVTGYTSKQAHYPEQTPVFMDRIASFSERFGIRTLFPVYDDFDDREVTRHLLEDYGLPSTGGGERKCLFCQTMTTATPADISAYLDEMVPLAGDYLDHRLAGRIHEAAACFPPGNRMQIQGAGAE